MDTKKLFSFLAFSTAALAVTPQTPQYSCWSTGPLLCPSYACVLQGQYNIEPYLYVNTVYATYNDNWRPQSQTNFIQVINSSLVQVGLTDYFNVSLTPQFFYQAQGNDSSANIGDLPLQAMFSVLNEDLNGATPGILIGIRASAPLGRYQNLSPVDAVDRATGAGSWRPALTFTIGKQLHFKDVHFLTLRAYFSPQFTNSFSVRGFHTYGGGYKTKGTITLGAQYTTIASFEYSFSRHGVFAFDFMWQRNNKITFKGKAGYTDQTYTTPASNGDGSSDQLSIAPAFEYNFNENVGLIGGVWFSIAGRNAGAFVCPTFALNIEY